MELQSKIKLLIIDDSSMVRDVFTKELSKNTQFESIFSASDTTSGSDQILLNKPDIILLDLDIPRFDTIEFLRGMMSQFPTPVIALSSSTHKGKHTTLQAMVSGAIDFIIKPSSEDEASLKECTNEIIIKSKALYAANAAIWNRNKLLKRTKADELPFEIYNKSKEFVIAIGASAGGIDTLKKLITELPSNMPPILIVQNMPAGFTKTFADRLNELSMIQVKEAENGDKLISGRVLIAPGDYHMKVVKSDKHFMISCENGEKVNGNRPSIDVMMFSVAEHFGSKAIGVILTGDGKDGALGLKAMKTTGARTIAQDEASSIVYTLPKLAFDNGSVDLQLDIKDISTELIKIISTR